MGLLDLFSGKEELDDILSLPVNLQGIYKNPHKALGLDATSTDINLLREMFRKGCLSHIPHFVGCGKSKLTEQELNFAYHLVRGNIKGPAKLLADTLDSNPYLEFRADYILPLLKPMKGNIFCSKEYRGFRMLAVTNSSYRTSVSYMVIPKFNFIFDVHYVMRGHKLERDYEEFIQLHAELEKELLTVPLLPEFVVGETVESFGRQLAKYLVRIHFTLANKGLFSPRLMKFLDIDYERVQTEEEGALVALLDTPFPPSQTAWHMIDEKWLSTWRKFVMGRGPRRYFAPGPIDNHNLVQQLKCGRLDLVATKDYRSVTFNVWRFYQLVHGGGPTISRLLDDIYSPRAYSLLQAVILIQTLVRIFLGRRRRQFLFMRRLSTTQVAKSVIIEVAKENVLQRAEQMILEQRRVRTKRNLEHAAIFTQSLWRLKKQYVPEANLELKQRDQEVFSKVKNVSKDVPESTGGEGVVISDLQSIVHIGSTYVYRRVLTDFETGIPFSISRRVGTQDALIEKSSDASQFVQGSRILSVNGFPTAALSYEEIKMQLTKATFPVHLELEQPLSTAMVPSLDQIISMGQGDDVLRFSAFKLMLQSGIQLVKYNSGNNKFHLTTLRISDKNLYYKSAYDYKKDEDELWNSFSLFKLKFVLQGDESITVRTKKLNNKYCFEIVSDDRGLVFEFPTAEQLQILVTRENDKKEARRRQAEEARLAKENSKRRGSFNLSNISGSARGSVFGGSSRASMTSPVDAVTAAANAAVAATTRVSTAAVHVSAGAASAAVNASSLAVHASAGAASAAVTAGTGAAINVVNMPKHIMHKTVSTVYDLLGKQSVLGVDQDQHAAKCDVIVQQLRRLVEEVRGSQIFVDKSGMPIRRTKPKVTLRKIDN